MRDGVIESITPMTDGRVSQMHSSFNRDDLQEFLDQVCGELPIIAAESEEYISLSIASRMRTDTGKLMGWFLNGKLPRTSLLNGVKRLDHLRFCRADVSALIEKTGYYDRHRLFSVSLMLRTSLPAIKRLISKENGGPWLIPVGPKECKKLPGSAYVSAAEIKRFESKYLTPGLIGKMFGIHYSAALRTLNAHSVDPVVDPKELGACIYRRCDVMSVATYLHASKAPATATQTGCSKDAPTIKFDGKNRKTGKFGESDASVL